MNRLAVVFMLVGVSLSQSFDLSEFQRRFNKNYASPAEQEYRLKVIKQNLGLLIQVPVNDSKKKVLLGSSLFRPDLNESLPPSQRLERLSNCYQRDMNGFLDLTDEEFSRFYLLPYDSLYRDSEPQRQYAQSVRLGTSIFGRRLQRSPNIPQQVNYVSQGFITAIKDQQKCNSCYAFAATAAVEAAYKRVSRSDLSLSEQEILDCSTEDSDCVGGQPSTVMQYIVKNGIASTQAYPYEAKKGTCRRRRILQAKKKSLLGFNLDFSQNMNSGASWNSPGSSWNSPVSPWASSSPFSPSYPSSFPSSFPSNSPFNPSYSPFNPPRNPTYPSTNYPTNPPTSPTNPPRSPTNPPANHPTNPPANPPQSNGRFSGLKSFRFVKSNINALLQELAKGPVVVAMYVSQAFKFYSDGVFNGDGCDGNSKANHAALAVGYDLSAEIPYILVKNSWGATWGAQGYYKIAIGTISDSAQGLCLLAATEFNIVAEI